MKVISIVGYHKTGKTTLVERLVAELAKRGRVGTVKHTREEILPLTGDTERHLNAGAEVTIGVTQSRFIKIVKSTDLKVVLNQLLDEGLDFAVVEGFKESGLPKIGIGDVVADDVIARVSIDATGAELAEIALAQPDYISLEHLLARILRGPSATGTAAAVGTLSGNFGSLQDLPDSCGLESPIGGVTGSLDRLRDELKTREGVLDALVYYDAGLLNPGQVVIYLVVLANTPDEASSALRYASGVLQSRQ